MTTQSLATPAVRMPRGTSVTAEPRTPKAADGSGHLNGRLDSLTALALAAVAAVVVTALVRVAV
ncbi:hypothetical protein [Methylobacterium persicinum]|uniref:Uncharacterized protein n=1 Tax=Methylobacterium persicinum TaxID=374426 RepID=A0ABU0HG67_9HYPH|nr:hypothetical protein [Methylobacterium persicinum]MDQ0441305.1 hypothetical protein [Methylobacterium persicinum]GJE36351.1 hypothetical protein KHHGKMAE_0399 [Methylobacterium persicinum]